MFIIYHLTVESAVCLQTGFYTRHKVLRRERSLPSFVLGKKDTRRVCMLHLNPSEVPSVTCNSLVSGRDHAI